MYINIDELLYQDMKWLGEQIELPISEFLAVAYRLDLRQEDWENFWKIVRVHRNSKIENFEKIQCIINDKERSFTKDEYEVVKQIFGSFPEEISNCCSAKILPMGICSDCKDHCGIIYLFE